MHRFLCVLASILLVVAVACGDQGIDVDAANEAAPAATRYVAPGPLIRDLERGGLTTRACSASGSVPGPVPGTVTSLTRTCSVDGESLTVNVFLGAVGPVVARHFATSFLQGMEEFGGDAYVLRGPNWVLTGDGSVLVEAQAVIGGRLIEG